MLIATIGREGQGPGEFQGLSPLINRLTAVPRVTVIADVDSPGERESLEAWMEKWQSRRTFTLENWVRLLHRS